MKHHGMINLLVLAALWMTAGCASSEKKETAPNAAAKEQSDQVKVALVLPDEKTTAAAKAAEDKASEKKEEKTAPAPTASAEVKAELAKIRDAVTEAKEVVKKNEEVTGVAPEKALGWLKNGNTRYLKGFLRKDGQTKADIQRLSKGQRPHSIILSCSDSRVPPELLFDQKLGEVFVVRTAGEALDPSVIASIEYAVEHLGSRLVVVMGHTSCGAVKATLDSMAGADLGSPHLNHLAGDLMPRLKEFTGQARSSNLAVESFTNAKGVAKDLVLRSSIIREKFEKNEIKIVTALYNLENGKVDFE